MPCIDRPLAHWIIEHAGRLSDDTCARVAAAGAKITYTYDVFWEESQIAWSSRWDAYLKMPGGRVGT